MQKLELKLVDVKFSSNSLCFFSRYFFFLVSLGSNENIDKNMFGSMKDFKSNKFEKLQNIFFLIDILDNKIF